MASRTCSLRYSPRTWKATASPRTHIIKVDLEDYKNRAMRNPDNLYAYVESRITDGDMYYILLDEVQMLDRFEDVLNGFLRIRNADVYVTGSNAKFLSKDIITEFRGRASR